MESVNRTPTEPADYAALSAIYGALLAGTALSARKRASIPAAELPALAAASFALSKLVVNEKVESWMRQPFVDEDSRAPEGAAGCASRSASCSRARAAPARGARSASSRCACTRPNAGRTVSSVLAASAGNDLLQATFKAICAHANAALAGRRRARSPAGRLSAS